MIEGLKQVNIGSGGNVTLINADGIVLYSHDLTHFLKPAPEHILSLFGSGESNWRTTSDMDGNAAVVAYSSLDGDLDKSLGWHLLITQSQKEINRGSCSEFIDQSGRRNTCGGRGSSGEWNGDYQ